jgi:hypothetical protein
MRKKERKKERIKDKETTKVSQSYLHYSVDLWMARVLHVEEVNVA